MLLKNWIHLIVNLLMKLKKIINNYAKNIILINLVKILENLYKFKDLLKY